MPNLELERVQPVSDFRKIAIGTWRTAYDPSVYGTMDVVMDPAMDYIDRFRAATGLRLTVSHMMAKAVAAALVEIPDANAILRFHRVQRRKTIGVFFQVAMTDDAEKIDLSGATVYGVDKLSLKEVIEDFQAKVDKVRKREDPALEKTRRSFRPIPFFLMHRVLRLISFVMYTLNIAPKGMPKDPFGSIMITNVGSLGLDTAYVPLVPYSRVPMLLALGAVKEVPMVADGQIVIRKRMSINATFDHRLIDGFHAAVMSRVLHQWFAEPDKYFGAVPAAAARPEALPAPEEAEAAAEAREAAAG